MFSQDSPAPLTIGSRRGRLALWFNYTPDGEVDRLSSHSSEALRVGEKATLAYFVYAPIACAAIEPALAQTPEAACASF